MESTEQRPEIRLTLLLWYQVTLGKIVLSLLAFGHTERSQFLKRKSSLGNDVVSLITLIPEYQQGGKKHSVASNRQAQQPCPSLSLDSPNTEGQAPAPSSSKVGHLCSGLPGRTWYSLWLEFSFSAQPRLPQLVVSPRNLMSFNFLAFYYWQFTQ